MRLTYSIDGDLWYFVDLIVRFMPILFDEYFLPRLHIYLHQLFCNNQTRSANLIELLDWGFQQWLSSSSISCKSNLKGTNW